MQTCAAIEGCRRRVLDFVIGLGSNLGAPSANLALGCTRLCELPDTSVTALSRVFESDPVGPPQPRYLNAAARLRSALGPQVLLERLQAIEHALGRVRDVRWGPRTLDLDVLWAERPVQLPSLEIPHPRLCERTFALAPLLDVAPELSERYEAALRALGGPPEVRGRLTFVHGGGVRCDCEPASFV
jgi:2-amino-4-hydroxy-6-hydroxymethyldihydropteridine diphosphokinase